MNQETVSQMSTGDMERTIFQILTDNGMSEKEANDTVDGMSFSDMERYLLEAGDNQE